MPRSICPLPAPPSKPIEKKSSVTHSDFEPQPPEPFFSNYPDTPKFDDMWYDDPIEGKEAIAAAAILQQKIEEKATPIRTWLERNIVPLLLQALGQLVKKRPGDIKAQCEFVADHLLKYNPLKDTYPDEYATKPKDETEVPCGFTIPDEVFDKAEEANPCGCKQKCMEEPAKEDAKPPSAANLAKKTGIVADAMKSAAAPDALRESVLARAKAGGDKK